MFDEDLSKPSTTDVLGKAKPNWCPLVNPPSQPEAAQLVAQQTRTFHSKWLVPEICGAAID